MSYVVRRATEADAEAMAEVVVRAFEKDHIANIIYPNGQNPSTMASGAARHRKEMADPKAIVQVVEDTTTGTIVAGAKWGIRSEEVPREEWEAEQPPPQLGEGANMEAVDAFFGQLKKKRKEHLQGRPHIILDRLYALPGHQRKGLGGMLMAGGVQYADEHGLGSYLEASEAGYGLYYKWGYRDVDTVELDLTRFGGEGRSRHVVMIRPAGAAGGAGSR